MSAVDKAKNDASSASAPPALAPTRPATPPPSPARAGAASVPNRPFPNIRPDGLGLALAGPPATPPRPDAPPLSPPPTPCRDPSRPPFDGELEFVERRFDRFVRAHAAAAPPPAPPADASPPDGAERLEDAGDPDWIDEDPDAPPTLFGVLGLRARPVVLPPAPFLESSSDDDEP